MMDPRTALVVIQLQLHQIESSLAIVTPTVDERAALEAMRTNLLAELTEVKGRAAPCPLLAEENLSPRMFNRSVTGN